MVACFGVYRRHAVKQRIDCVDRVAGAATDPDGRKPEARGDVPAEMGRALEAEPPGDVFRLHKRGVLPDRALRPVDDLGKRRGRPAQHSPSGVDVVRLEKPAPGPLQGDEAEGGGDYTAEMFPAAVAVVSGDKVAGNQIVVVWLRLS